MHSNRRPFGAWRAATAALAVLATVTACGGDDDVVPPPPAATCATQVNDTEEKLLACVTLDGVRAHLTELSRLAAANGGNRASGEPGYEAAVVYAEKVFGDAGYTVSRVPFDFVAYTDLGGSVLQQTAPGAVADLPHAVMSYSGSGSVTGPVTVAANLGCDAADFAGFTAGHVALVSRGECTFEQKANNAIAAGASGVVIYNNAAGDLAGTLGDTFTANVPVLGITQALGQQLAVTPGLALALTTSTTRVTNSTFNVLAESKGGDPNHVVMVGAHLDSVHEGPGINDNGTGTAAVLETAVQMARVTPKYRVRFALWGGEEAGLLGSTDYVERLSDADGAKIALYLNFDMIGSPNAGYFIYDGDDSDAEGEAAGPAGSDLIEKRFEAFYTARNKAFQGTDFDGRSDYGPFIAVGIPAGGLFTGAEDLKTAEQAALWGGTAGTAFDPCYHAACDTLSNLDDAALDLNSDAVAAATLHFANNLDGFLTTAGPTARAQAYTPPKDMRPKHLPPLR